MPLFTQLRGLTIGVALMTTATILTGQEPAKPVAHALVSDVGTGQRSPGGDEDECDVKDQTTKKMIFTESEIFASKLLVGTLAAANKYEEVRKSETMQNMAVPNDATGEWIKSLLNAHHSYTTSAPIRTVSSGKVSATLPPAAVAIAGIFMLGLGDRAVSTGELMVQNRSLRLGIKSLIGSAAISSAVNFSANAILTKALPRTALELTIAEQKQIREQLDQGVGAPAKFLGEVLRWNEAQRGQFSRALNRKVIETLVKSAAGTVQIVDDRHRGNVLESRIVANVADISLVDVIKQENLASDEQLAALKQLQEMQDIARKLQSQAITPKNAKQALTVGTVTMKDRILALRRLHRLLTQTEKDLTEGPAKKEMRKLAAETAKAVETIQALCEVGK